MSVWFDGLYDNLVCVIQHMSRVINTRSAQSPRTADCHYRRMSTTFIFGTVLTNRFRDNAGLRADLLRV